MGPLVWWWRWWLGTDPNRAGAAQVGVIVREQQQVMDDLTEELSAREAEIERLRAEVAALERVRDDSDSTRARLTAENDQARASVDEARADADRARNDADQARTEAHQTRAEADQAHNDADQARAEADQARAEADQARAEADQARAEADQARAEADDLRERLASRADEATESPASEGAGAPVDQDAEASREQEAPSSTGAPADVTRGAEVLGRRVTLDDLTVIDGVGPKIAAALDDAGYGTWRAVADADPAQIREALVAANPRYRMHDPTDWPAQAALLADGRWEEFAQRADD